LRGKLAKREMLRDGKYPAGGESGFDNRKSIEVLKMEYGVGEKQWLMPSRV
jgi:hypothetical protein